MFTGPDAVGRCTLLSPFFPQRLKGAIAVDEVVFCSVSYFWGEEAS